MTSNSAPDLSRLRIPSRTFGEREVAIYGALSQDHNPIHSDKVFAATTPFGYPIVYGFLFVMPIWNALLGAFGNEAFFSSKAEVRFVRPLLVGQTAHYAVDIEKAPGGLLIRFTITDGRNEPVAVAQVQIPVNSKSRELH